MITIEAISEGRETSYELRVDAGESYRSVARNFPTLTRQGIMNIHTDEERRRWYLDTTADDERVNDALDFVEQRRIICLGK